MDNQSLTSSIYEIGGAKLTAWVERLAEAVVYWWQKRCQTGWGTPELTTGVPLGIGLVDYSLRVRSY